MSTEMKPKATRQAFGEMLAELGATNPKIVVLDADLSKSTKSEMFAKKYPERFFEMGIAEANMIGTGAGFGMNGYVPFICSFGAFVTGRYDQIRMSVSYADANVKIVGTHAGVGIGDDGHSQMGLEDVTLMRAMPNMKVFQPSDEMETRAVVKFMSEDKGPAYIRLTRQNLKPVHGADYKWQFGKLDVLKQGSGTLVLCTGGVVQECMDAMAMNKSAATLVNVHTLKPFDAKGLIELVRTHKKVVTVEDHYTTGGLGSIVAEVLAEAGLGIPLKRLGVHEQFGESGEPIELLDKHGISARKLAEQI